MTLSVYHATHTRSLRIIWLLEEMGLAYALKKVDLAVGNTGGDAYGEVNPLQKLPAIVVDGKLMIESTAILEFLAHKFDGENLVLPVEHKDYGQFLQWLHGGESAFGMYLSLYFGHTVLLPEKDRSEQMAAWSAMHLQKTFALFGQNLGDQEFIAGEQFTLADISVGYVAYGLTLLGKLDEFAPKNVQSWWASLSKRPAFEKALSL